MKNSCRGAPMVYMMDCPLHMPLKPCSSSSSVEMRANSTLVPLTLLKPTGGSLSCDCCPGEAGKRLLQLVLHHSETRRATATRLATAKENLTARVADGTLSREPSGQHTECCWPTGPCCRQ